MEKDFKKKIYILGGLCLFFLALIVLLGKGVQKRQVMRQRAAGGPVNLSLSPTEGNIDQNGITISLVMTNTTSTSKNIRGAEAVLTLDANAVSRFEVSSAACSSTFPNSAQPPVASGNRVALTCYSGGGNNPVSLGSATLGTFVLKAKSGATAGNGNISFTSANIPESGTYTNLYGSGITGTFTVPGAVVPTATATPVGPTLTPTPTPPAAGASCSPVGVWDSVNCRRCQDNSRWGEICTDYGRFGPTPPTDPGASLATWCSCFRRCNLTATPPPACPPLTPIPTATPTASRVGCNTICEFPAPEESDQCTVANPALKCTKVTQLGRTLYLCRNKDCSTANDCQCPVATATSTQSPTPRSTATPTPTPTITCRGGCYQPTAQGLANCNTNCQSVAGQDCVRIDQVGLCSFAPAYRCCYRIVAPTPTITPTPTNVPGTRNCHERCDLAGSTPTYGKCKTGLSCGQVPGSTRIGMCLNLACPDKEDCVCPCQTCPAGAPAKASGNANCDGRIDIIDFGIWVNEFRGVRLSKDADFNCDNKVDIVDFAIWRQNRQ